MDNNRSQDIVKRLHRAAKLTIYMLAFLFTYNTVVFIIASFTWFNLLPNNRNISGSLACITSLMVLSIAYNYAWLSVLNFSSWYRNATPEQSEIPTGQNSRYWQRLLVRPGPLEDFPFWPDRAMEHTLLRPLFGPDQTVDNSDVASTELGRTNTPLRAPSLSSQITEEEITFGDTESQHLFDEVCTSTDTTTNRKDNNGSRKKNKKKKK